MKLIYKIIFSLLVILSIYLIYENHQLRKTVADRDAQLERAAEQYNAMAEKAGF